ncbi:50S ribosomal protein L25 [bacterium]|nr:50S ribosomal protein L25 [bacterium]
MEQAAIAAQLRKETGTSACRRLRRSDRIPAVLYGRGNVKNLSVQSRDFVTFMHHLRSEHAVVQLAVENEGASLNVLIKDIQRSKVTHDIIHVDFLEVDLEQVVTISVPLEFQGEPDGVKNFGGVLEPLLRDVEVQCKAKEIPDLVTVDVSALRIHDVIHISELPQMQGVVYTGDPGTPVVTVAPPTVIAEPTPAAEGAAPAEPVEPEVIGRAKKEEEEEEEGAAKEEKKEKK